MLTYSISSLATCRVNVFQITMKMPGSNLMHFIFMGPAVRYLILTYTIISLATCRVNVFQITMKMPGSYAFYLHGPCCEVFPFNEKHIPIMKICMEDVTVIPWSLHIKLINIAYTFRESREFVFIIIVQFMTSANIRIRFGLQIVVVCLYSTPTHYHHCVNLSEGVELIKCLSDIFCRVCE